MTAEVGVATAARAPGRQLTVAAIGTALVLMAFTLPLGTLPATAADLDVGPGAQAWILGGVSLGAAAALLTSGALGDDHGRRRVFLVGVALLCLSSLTGALAPFGWVLIAARVAQGLGGAAILACSLGLISHAYAPGRERDRLTGLWGAALGLGAALGPFLSVGLAAVGGWRLPYLAIAAIATVLAVAGRRVLAESRGDRPRRVDVLGTLLLGLGSAGMLAGLVQGRESWTDPITIGLLVAGPALLAAFLVAESCVREPMLDLGLFRRADFVGTTVAAVATGAGLLALSNVIPTVVETGLGHGPFVAVAMLFAWSGTSSVAAVAARWIPPTVGPRSQLTIGLIGMATGQVAMTGMTPDGPLGRLLPGLIIAGAFNGIVNAALGRQAVASVPADRAAMGSGANNTARYLGSAIGIAIVVMLIHQPAPTAAAGTVAGWNLAAGVTAVFSTVGAVVVLFVRSRKPSGGSVEDRQKESV